MADSQGRQKAAVAKGGGLPFQFGLRTVVMPSTLVSWFFGVRERGEYIMRNRVDIDSSHSRAIVREIGERLKSSLKEDRELPVTFRMQIERLRQLEGDAQANVLGPCRVNRGFRLRRMRHSLTGLIFTIVGRQAAFLVLASAMADRIQALGPQKSLRPGCTPSSVHQVLCHPSQPAFPTPRKDPERPIVTARAAGTCAEVPLTVH